MKTLFPAQQKARDFFVSVHLNRGLNTLDTSMVGTGKTVVSASLAIALGFPVAVVCPKSVIVSWKRELLEHGIEPIFVLNYESLRTGNTVYLKKAGKKIMRWALPPDTLIIFESGTAPSFKSVQIPIPLPLAGQVGVTPISFPVVETHSDNVQYTKVAVGNEKVGLSEVVDFNLMAKRALKDEMPGIVTRSIVRAISKAVAQQVANQQDDSGVTGLLLLIGGLIMEGADERTWRTLPSTISIGRARFSEGTYKLLADSPFGKVEQEVKISGKSKIILVRQIGNTVSIQSSKTIDEAKTEIASNEVIEKSNVEETKPALDNKEKPNLMKKWLDKLNLKKAE
jgi:hypothetical protein